MSTLAYALAGAALLAVTAFDAWLRAVDRRAAAWAD